MAQAVAQRYPDFQLDEFSRTFLYYSFERADIQREYERRSYIKQYGENTKASREREAMRQNAQTSLKAPVRGVYGGGATDTSPSDDFLAGFNADNW